jgi:methionine-gamma-lyase
MKSTKYPESLMMSYGYDHTRGEGAVKVPLYQTSTFVFENAEAGKAFFEVAYGLREKEPNEELGLIYSRIDNPNLSILEKRLCLWDKADDCAVFQSGMAAISTVLWSFLKPGDLLMYSQPTYGGTDHFITDVLTSYGIHIVGFRPGMTKQEMITTVEATGRADRLKFIYLETPANPTVDLIDIEQCRAVADHFSSEENKVLVGVDNTYMGPVWSHPLKLGADLVLYSATKYIGGHSDLLAGAVLGNAELMKQVRVMRTFFGNMPSPQTCWLLSRSLETLKIRMEQQCENAQIIAQYLEQHPAVEKVYYLGLINETDPMYRIYQKQYSAPGAMIAFDVIGGEAEAFTVLNNFELISLAVSLGSTESLAQHPATMTHVGVAPERRKEMGVTEKMVRLSVGIENVEDLIDDLEKGLTAVMATRKVDALETM